MGDQKLMEDAGFLASILASSTDCIKVLDLNGNLTFMSEGAQRVMEVSDFNALRGCPWPKFWQGKGHVAALAAVEAARAGGMGHFQGAADTMAGNPRFWDVRVTPIRGPDGRPEKLLSISRDITTAQKSDTLLRESEQRWRGLFEQLREGLILGELVRDASGKVIDWRYVETNRAWGELVGLPPQAAIGRTIREVFPGIEDVWIDQMASLVETGGPVAFTRQVGVLGRWYDGRAFVLGGDRFAIMFLEVTAQRHADLRRQALLDLDDRLRDMADPAEMSFEAAEIIGRTLGVSRAGYGVMFDDGASMDVIRDWTAPGVASVMGRHRLRAYGVFLDNLRRGEAVVIDDTHEDPRTASGTDALGTVGVRALVNLPLVENSRLVAIFFVTNAEPRQWTADELAFMRNVAARTRSAIERRRAEQDLRELAESLERQVEERTRERDRVWRNAQDLIVIIDTAGVFRHVNPAVAAVLGWAPDEMVGRTVFDFVLPDDHQSTGEALSRATHSELPTYVNRYRHKNGSFCWISWVAAPESDLIYAYGRDITAEREQAAALKSAEEALRQSQKMEAVGQLTGGLAHDFNNLLTGISGSLDLLQKRVAQGRINDLDRYLIAAQGASRRAAALTHRLLAFSRRQTLDPKATDVHKLVVGMAELIRRTVGPEITVETVDMVGLWVALVDPHQLENALLNLCINARDAMPDGGRITIETANRWMDDRTAHERDVSPGQYLSLCVSDTGTGMSSDVIARAFDPFFTTKPLGQGTGLGLSMIYGFARQSGGQVRIYSEVGQGTMVCIYLPRHYGNGAGADATVLPGEAPHAVEGETVLVVDDESTVRMLVGDVLADTGYAAIEAEDGPSGLKVLQSAARVDLLITDVGLPGGMNGRQVADAARLLRPGLKVLFITGYAENAVIGNGHLDPGMAILTKPFNIDDLASKIRDLIGR